MADRPPSILARHRRWWVPAVLLGGAAAVWVGLGGGRPADPFRGDYTEDELATWVDRGRTVFAQQNCAECHRVGPAGADAVGAGLKGPPLVGIVGKPAVLDDGRSVVRGADYLRRSILDSRVQVVEGYRFQVMPDYHHLDADQVKALLLYLRSLDGPE